MSEWTKIRGGIGIGCCAMALLVLFVFIIAPEGGDNAWQKAALNLLTMNLIATLLIGGLLLIGDRK